MQVQVKVKVKVKVVARDAQKSRLRKGDLESNSPGRESATSKQTLEMRQAQVLARWCQARPAG